MCLVEKPEEGKGSRQDWGGRAGRLQCRSHKGYTSTEEGYPLEDPCVGQKWFGPCPMALPSHQLRSLKAESMSWTQRN